MRVLLALLPYLASTFVYWLSTIDFFAQAGGKLPGNAVWRLTVPVLIGGGLTPLAVAANTTGPRILLLLSCTGLSLVFCLIVLGAVRDQRHFLRLYRPASFRRYTIPILTGRNVILSLGVAVIAYGAVMNMAAP